MKIFVSGKVYTQSGMKEAFVVDGSRFVYAGSNEEALRYEGDVTDLQGQFVCAGLNDSHMHLLHFGQALTLADLSSCTGSREEMLDGLRSFAAENPVEEGKWLIGLGFNQDYFSGEKRFPTCRDLDQVSTEYPIMISRACGHMCTVNSKALEIMKARGIIRGGNGDSNGGLSGDPNGSFDSKRNGNRNSDSVEGGSVERDERGELTGIFWENAIELVNSCIPPYTIEDMKRMLAAASRWVNRQGITSVQTDDLVTLPSVDWRLVLQAYQELKAEGRLTVRVNEQSQLTDREALQAFLDEGYTTNVGDEWFKIGPLKIIGDGSLGARSAYLLEEYADAAGQRGMVVTSLEKMVDLITLAHTHQMQVAVHAIGDGCVEQVLEAYETVLAEYPREDHRHGVVHCQIMRPEHYERFRANGIHAYVQSVFLDYDMKIVEDRVGKSVAESSYGGHSYFELGISMSNGSDAPVERPIPLNSMQCAVTRRDLACKLAPYRPQEAMTVKEALDSYTVGGAYASFEEHVKGDIREGMLADFVVLYRSPFEAEAEELAGLKVIQTWVDGRCVYCAE